MLLPFGVSLSLRLNVEFCELPRGLLFGILPVRSAVAAGKNTYGATKLSLLAFDDAITGCLALNAALYMSSISLSFSYSAVSSICTLVLMIRFSPIRLLICTAV